MRNKWVRLSSILVLGMYLAACSNTTEEDTAADDSSEVAEETNDSVEDTDDATADDEDHEEESDHDHDEVEADQDAPETVEIEGVQDHYHSGALIELIAVFDEEVEYDDWHWYISEHENDEWDVVEGQGTEEFIYEALDETFEVRAVLYDTEHNAYAQSPAVEIVVDNH